MDCSLKPLTIKPLTGEHRESQRGAAEDDARMVPKDGGDESGSKNGDDSEEGNADDDAECHESFENEDRSAKMS